MKTIKFLFTAVIIGLTLTSCNKDNDEMINVDFEAQFEQLAVGGFGIEEGFATLALTGSTNKGGAYWNNPQGLSYGQLTAKSAKSTQTSNFTHVYFDAGTIDLSTDPDSGDQSDNNLIYEGWFPSSTAALTGGTYAALTEWTPYLGAPGVGNNTAYSYALAPGTYNWVVAQTETIPNFSSKLGFSSTITTTLQTGTNTINDFALQYSQSLVTVTFPTGTTASAVSLESGDGTGTFTIVGQVAYIYVTDGDITSVTVGGETYTLPDTVAAFLAGGHYNFNVVPNASGGFTITPGGAWIQDNVSDIGI